MHSLPVGANEGFSGRSKLAMPTSLIWECSNSVLHLGQMRIHLGILQLEPVTANKLESTCAMYDTVHQYRTQRNRVRRVLDSRKRGCVPIRHSSVLLLPAADSRLRPVALPAGKIHAGHWPLEETMLTISAMKRFEEAVASRGPAQQILCASNARFWHSGQRCIRLPPAYYRRSRSAPSVRYAKYATTPMIATIVFISTSRPSCAQTVAVE